MQDPQPAQSDHKDRLEASTWCYSIDQPISDVNRYMPLSSMDLYYFEHPHRRQSIALQFSTVLDPLILCQSLGCTIGRFPSVGSRIKVLDGISHFHFDSEQVKIRLVVVNPKVLSCKYEWSNTFDMLSKKAGEEEPLFQAFLLRCNDESYGSVLMAGFAHTVGDAASYALFLTDWSDTYARLSLLNATNTRSSTPPNPDDIPYGVLPESAPNLSLHFPFPGLARRYVLPATLLTTIKAALGGALTTNDALLAQCACALAPHRRPPPAPPPAPAPADARIVLMVDCRGRGWAAGRFGNGVSSVSVAVPWAVLLAGDVAAAAAVLAPRVRAALRQLQDAPAAAAAAGNAAAGTPKLFVWNSWARAGAALRRASFGDPAGPRSVEWLNALCLADPAVVLVTAAGAGGGLAVQLTPAGEAEARALDAAWGAAAAERLRSLNRESLD